MSRATDRELSPAAAHRILRSLACWDWTKSDQAAGSAQGLAILVDAPARDEVFDDIGGDDDLTPSPTFQLLKRAGGWYLNEVPEELLRECENELRMSDPLIDLRKAPGMGDDGDNAETPEAGRRDHPSTGEHPEGIWELTA